MLPRRCLGVSVALRFFVVVRWIPSAGEFDFFVALRLCLANPNPGLDKEVAGYSSCGCDIGSFVCGVISFRELIGIVEIRSLNICYHEIVELFRCRFIRALCLSHLVYWYLKPILQVHFELFCDWIVIILDASVVKCCGVFEFMEAGRPCDRSELVIFRAAFRFIRKNSWPSGI